MRSCETLGGLGGCEIPPAGLILKIKMNLPGISKGNARLAGGLLPGKLRKIKEKIDKMKGNIRQISEKNRKNGPNISKMGLFLVKIQ